MLVPDAARTQDLQDLERVATEELQDTSTPDWLSPWGATADRVVEHGHPGGAGFKSP